MKRYQVRRLTLLDSFLQYYALKSPQNRANIRTCLQRIKWFLCPTAFSTWFARDIWKYIYVYIRSLGYVTWRKTSRHTWLFTVTTLGTQFNVLHISNNNYKILLHSHTLCPGTWCFVSPTRWVYAPKSSCGHRHVCCGAGRGARVLIFVYMNIKAGRARIVRWKHCIRSPFHIYQTQYNGIMCAMCFCFSIYISLFDHVLFWQINSPRCTQAYDHATLQPCGSATICTTNNRYARNVVSCPTSTAKNLRRLMIFINLMLVHYPHPRSIVYQ